MRFTIIAQIISYFGCIFCIFCVPFAVKKSQYIPIISHLAIIAQIVEERLVICLQRFNVSGSALFISSRIYLEFELVQTYRFEHFNRNKDYHGIRDWQWRAYEFNSKLVKLPHSSGLRAFIPKHWAIIEKFLRQAL